MTQKDYKLELLAAIENNRGKDALTVTREFMAQKALDDLYQNNSKGMENLADLEAWETYCEASLGLSNQDDASDDTPWLDCADGFKNLPDNDADLIDSGSKVG